MKTSSKYETIDKDDADWVNSLSRGLLILECFTRKHPRLVQSQIQKLTNIPKATLFRLLRTLAGLNYLKYDEESRKYYLGPRVLSLGFSVLQTLEAREIARPYLESLAKEFNNSISLVMLDKSEMVFIDRIQVPSPRDFHVSVGSRIPVYNTSAGKAVLAYLSRENLEQVIDQIKRDARAAPYVRNNGARLINSLTEVRREGYALSDEQSLHGVRAIAAPIFSPEGVAYAIHMVVPPERTSIDELRRKYAPRLIAVGKEISEAMGHQHEEEFEEGPRRGLIGKGRAGRVIKNDDEDQRWRKVKKIGS